MFGYKAFSPDWKCRGFQYEIGKTYELLSDQPLEICKCGFHFCVNPIDVFQFYPWNTSVIAQVEVLGKIQQKGNKFVTDKIKIVREVTRQELEMLISAGKYNIGKNNTGCFNIGRFNSGSYNTESFNTGNHNTGSGNYGYYNSGSSNAGSRNTGNSNNGHRNSGNNNDGNDNTGSYNIGHFNTGDYNSGRSNVGDHNSGSFNVGWHNIGHYNTGHFNSGHCNSGYFNSGDYNSGIFNTDEPMMRAFNKETNIRYSDFLNNLDYDFFLLLKRIFTNQLIDGDIEKIKALPNFDAQIFKEITGIDIEKGLKYD